MRRVQYVALAVSAVLGGAAAYHMYAIDTMSAGTVLLMTAGIFWFIISDMDVDKMLANAHARLEQED